MEDRAGGKRKETASRAWEAPAVSKYPPRCVARCYGAPTSTVVSSFIHGLISRREGPYREERHQLSWSASQASPLFPLRSPSREQESRGRYRRGSPTGQQHTAAGVEEVQQCVWAASFSHLVHSTFSQRRMMKTTRRGKCSLSRRRGVVFCQQSWSDDGTSPEARSPQDDLGMTCWWSEMDATFPRSASDIFDSSTLVWGEQTKPCLYHESGHRVIWQSGRPSC